MLNLSWKLHGDGHHVAAGEVVKPDERLVWSKMVGLSMQHVLAMFGSTAVVPVLLGFPPATTIFFAGIGTIIFIIATGNRVPSWTGSSFAFIAPVIAAKAHGGMPAALGGIFVSGVVLFLIGLLIDRMGYGFVDKLLPPTVTGAIVALIGLNLAPAAKDNFTKQPAAAVITLVAILLIGVVFKGFIGRMSVFLGVVVGYLFAAIKGDIDFAAVHHAAWVGLPNFTTPTFSARAILLIVPAVILVLLAENVGHIKAVAAMTDRNLDGSIGRAFMGGGVGTMLAGAFGGSGTTTYAENIGVMGITRIYSTAAYILAGLVGIGLGVLPKFGALVGLIPPGVLGGATTVLFGLIAVLGARVWEEGRVDFRDPVNLTTCAVAIIIGTGDYTLHVGQYTFGGITLGTISAILCYHLLRRFWPPQRDDRQAPTDPILAASEGFVAPTSPIQAR
jgi:uracil-xanthine permease